MSTPKLNRAVAPIIDCLQTNYVTISNEEFQQLLDQWAEIVYPHLCLRISANRPTHSGLIATMYSGA